MGWLVKLADIRSHVNKISEFTIGKWFEVCLRFVSPVFLVVILGTNIVNTLTDGYGGYAQFDLLLLGWGLIAAMLVVGIVINKSSKES